MKKIQFALLAVLAAAVFSLSSCLKSDEASGWDDALASGSLVSIVHASPGTGALDASFDQNRLNVNFFNYTDRIEYLRAYGGERNFAVYHEGSWDPVFEKKLTLKVGNYYTIFIVKGGNKMDAVLLRDSVSATAENSAQLRFANMSADAGRLDLYIKGNDEPVATNINFKGAGLFVNVPAAGEVVFEIKQAGTNVVLATSEKKSLLQGNFYTIWAGGLKAAGSNSDQQLRIEAVRH